jgi:hypothetical protein
MSLKNVAKKVTEHGGIRSFDMQELRVEYGATRLGANITSEISVELANLGIGHYPLELPTKQWGSVRLFDKTHVYAELVNLQESFDYDDDEKLQEMLSNEKNEIINSIRKLVARN